MKAIMLDTYALPGEEFGIEAEIFAKHGIEYETAQCRSEAEVIEKVRDADAVSTAYCDINKNVIAAMKKCRVLVRYGIGYDVIDVEAATKAGIAVCNIPDYCIQDVALHSLAMILNSIRKITMYDRSVRRNEWNSSCGYPVHRPEMLTLGLLGFGNIARRTAEFAKPLGFKMLAYDPYLPKGVFDEAGIPGVSLDELLAASDIVSVHAPLTPETRHIINKNTIAKMKDGVMIVNTSRGGLVNLPDLIAAINSGKVMAANLDVVDPEPFTGPNRDILAHENVTVTPHCSFNSIEAAKELHTKVAESACAVLTGKKPRNIVNRKQLGIE